MLGYEILQGIFGWLDGASYWLSCVCVLLSIGLVVGLSLARCLRWCWRLLFCVGSLEGNPGQPVFPAGRRRGGPQLRARVTLS